jgi:hypothetical protein
MITAQLPSRVQKRQDSAEPVGSFVLAFVGMLCATFIGFVSEMRPLTPDLPDRGYDEALGTQTYSVPGVTIPTHGSDSGASIAAGLRCGPPTPAIKAAVACVAVSATANPQPRTIGDDHVE